MARRKTAKRTGKQAARQHPDGITKVPANDLPPELIHMIFGYLKSTEAAVFRWSGRVVAEIGLQYLVPTVHLALKEESYERLLAIAEHPVVSMYVVKLEYEIEGLWPIGREDFDHIAIRTSAVSQEEYISETVSGSLLSARAWRAYKRQYIRNLLLPSRKHIDRAWSLYEQYRESQMKVQQAYFFPEMIAKAMKQFSNLKAISSSADGAPERYVAEIKGLLPTYRYPQYQACGDPSNVGATMSVMCAAQWTGLHIKDFCCQSVNWQIFTQSKKDLAVLKRSLFSVKRMDIAFTIRRGLEDINGLDGIVQEHDFISYQMVGKGCVADLVTSAPDLEYFGITFRHDHKFFMFPDMNLIIGNFFWPSLKAVNLQKQSTDGHNLVNFCKRHAHTIKDFSLGDMRVVEGSWNATFHGIRRVFRLGQQLDTCKLDGVFHGPRGHIVMSPELRCDAKPNDAGRVVSNYIRDTEVGDITLDEYCELRDALRGRDARYRLI